MTAQAVRYDDMVAVALPELAPARPAPRPRLRVVGPDEVAVGPRMRLTARGRLVRTLFVFGAVSLLALMVAARLTGPAMPDTHAVQVRPGDTLSEIAAAELPSLPLEAAVVRIRTANGLNSTAIVAGQTLVIPGRDS